MGTVKRKIGFLKSFLAVMLAFVMLVPLCPMNMGVVVSADTQSDDTVSRLIYVVYDDSNSMMWKELTTWSQAKYSLEIFSAMMQSEDSMEVYYMSQFSNYREGREVEPLIGNLSGKNPQVNIDTIHKTVSDTSGTYIHSILYAYDKLAKNGKDYDERHLVVITDGNSFNIGTKQLSNNETKKYLNDKFKNSGADDINVEYLAIGVKDVVPNTGNDLKVNVEHANVDDGSILEKVTVICERIFQRPKQNVSNNSLTLNFPVSEVVVFAQGKDAKIGDISGMKKSSTIFSSFNDEDRFYATSNATRNDHVGNSYDNIKVAKGLAGAVAVFKPTSGKYISEGTYKLDVSGNYSVYYKPCLDVVLKLSDIDGNLVQNGTEVDIGDYTAEYYLTYPKGHPKNGQPIQTDFSVGYTLLVNGAVHKSDTINLNEGNTTVSVVAKYLEYISTDASLMFAVADLQVEELKVEIDPSEIKCNLSQIADSEKAPEINVKVTLADGSALESDLWKDCQLTINCDGLDFDIKKNDDGQSFAIKPKYKNGKREDTADGEVKFTASASIMVDNRIKYKGKDEGVVNIYNDIKASQLTVEILEISPKEIKSDNFNGVSPCVKVKITWNGNPLTQEQYDALVLEGVIIEGYDLEGDNESAKDDLIIFEKFEKDPFAEGQDTTATVYFKAQGDADTQRKKLSGNDDFKIIAVIEREGVVNKAETEQKELGVTRAWTFWEIFWIIFWILFILFIILGYIVFKKYLPARIKYDNGMARKTFKPYKKLSTWGSVLIPFKNVTARMKVDFIDDNDVPCSPVLKIKASSKRKAEVLNAVELYKNSKQYLDASDTAMDSYLDALSDGRRARKPDCKLNYNNSILYKNSTSVVTFVGKKK